MRTRSAKARRSSSRLPARLMLPNRSLSAVCGKSGSPRRARTLRTFATLRQTRTRRFPSSRSACRSYRAGQQSPVTTGQSCWSRTACQPRNLSCCKAAARSQAGDHFPPFLVVLFPIIPQRADCHTPGVPADRSAQIVRLRCRSPALAFSTMPWKYPPAEVRKCAGSFVETMATAIAACSRPIVRQASPHSDFDTSRSDRRKAPDLARSGSAAADRASIVAPAAPARPDAASAPCPSPAFPAAAMPRVARRSRCQSDYFPRKAATVSF